MKKFKSSSLAMITAAAAVIFTVSLSAFSKGDKSSGERATIQFQYLLDTVSEAAFEDADNWQVLTGESPCDDGDIVCIAQATEEALNPFPGPSQEEQFAQLLSSQSDTQTPGATEYIQNNTSAKKPEATR